MSATAVCPNCADLHVVDGKMSVGEGVYQSGCPNCGMLGADDPTPEGAAHRWRSFCEAMARRVTVYEEAETDRDIAIDSETRARAGLAATLDRAERAERERDALIAAWPEREPCRLGESLVLPPTRGTDGPRMHRKKWPEVKRDIVRDLAGLDPINGDTDK